ncbi:MAG TPA: hypothetical protein VFP12_06130, partial [Allosphingosinicella sp.]|nr:hypothetical protein [Allosphingosinicella sp.]
MFIVFSRVIRSSVPTILRIRLASPDRSTVTSDGAIVLSNSTTSLVDWFDQPASETMSWPKPR